jgi:hypothetical protein
LNPNERGILAGILNGLAVILLAVCVLAVWKNGR